MKRLLLLTLSAMMTILMVAGNVTPEQARQQAARFKADRMTKGRHAPATHSQPILLTVPAEMEGLYLFNFDNDNGFVIVSGDDRTDAVLGYSDTGCLDPDNLPDNLRAWLIGYADELKWLDAHGITANTPRRTSAVKAPISPLMTTLWDQGSPYNNNVKTTEYFVYTDAVTGCVATAMAQVMYYTARKAGLNSSFTLKATESYTTSYSKTIPVVPAGTELKWSKMRNTYAESDSDEGAEAVAMLMQACGATVKMKYANRESGGSTASSTNVPQALIDYFGYEDATVQHVNRSLYTYLNWINMLYNELSQQRPVYYHGQSSGGGHAFVCDGYQGEDYFHINWGWGGTSDGYYKLSLLNPYEQGIGGSSTNDGFGRGQGAVVGIQLKGGTGTVLSNPSNLNLVVNSVSASATTVAKGESVDITFNITNKGSADYDGEIGLWLTIGASNMSLNGKMCLIPAGQTRDCVVKFEPKASMTEGTYHIDAYWPYYDTYVSLGGKTVDVTVTAASGSTTPSTDNINLGVTITIDGAEDLGSSNYNCFGTTITGKMTLTNPDATQNYKGYFQRNFYLYEGSCPDVDIFFEEVVVPAGGSLDIPIKISGLVIGKQYKFSTVYRKNSAWTDWIDLGIYNVNPGIIAYNPDGTTTITKAGATSYAAPAGVLLVDLTDAGVTTVSSAEPNCLFVIDKDDTAPTGSSNIIRFDGSSYTAATLSLTDGHDFVAPFDLTATSVEFTFANDRWADGTNGWNTIMLPFDVSEVTADGTAIDWFHSSTDHGKQFWLKEFTGDNGSTVDFAFANEMAANTPYIIALPGNKWGSAYDLSGKTIKFLGTNALIEKTQQRVVTGSNCRFIGNTQAFTTENIYCINATGNLFELKASGGCSPFRAFFKPNIFDSSVGSLFIGSGGNTTSIEAIQQPEDDETDGRLFDLGGRQISRPAAKGIVISRGRKVLAK